MLWPISYRTEQKLKKISNFCILKKSYQKIESRNEKESNLIQNQILKWVLYSQFIELSLNPYLRHRYLKSFQPRPLNNRSFDPVDTVSAISMTRKSLFMGPFKVSSPGPELIFNLTLGSGQKCSKSLKNSTFAIGQIDVGDGYCRQNILVTIARCC